MVSYISYLVKTIWPSPLAIFYPRPYLWPTWRVVGSAALLALITFATVWQAHKRPFLIFGWLWFLGTLLPVIGLVQLGSWAMADHYSYIPIIGLFVMIIWGAQNIACRWRPMKPAIVVASMAAIVACAVFTSQQLRYWQDSETLFRHALAVTPPNVIPHLKLGEALTDKGMINQGIKEFNEALQIETLIERARTDQNTTPPVTPQINPNLAYIHGKIAQAFLIQGKYAEAKTEYSTALQLNPGDVAIREALVYATQKVEIEKVLTNLYETLKIQPTPEAHAQIAIIQTIQGKFQDAVGHYYTALRIKPDFLDVLNNLAWLLATCPEAHIRDGAQAVKFAERACELTHYQKTIYIGTLAAAYAEAGRFDDALATAQKACALAKKSGEQNLLQKNQELLALYRAHQPYHEATEKLVPAGP